VGTEEVVDSFHYGADAPDWPYYPILSRALRCGDHVSMKSSRIGSSAVTIDSS
jgi:hypothetical protein